MADFDLKTELHAEHDAVTSAGGAGQTRVFPELSAEPGAGAAPGRLDMILDIPVQVSVELGRAKLPIRNLVQLAPGAVVELDRLAGEPMDVLVNGCLVAQGEVVVVNDKFGIRLTHVVSPDERLRRSRG
jgi:flagellar motor switch protein FliN/FliY